MTLGSVQQRTGTRALSVSVLVALAVSLQPASADTTNGRRALVVLRVLAYDKNLSVRAGSEVRILVVHPEGEDGAAERAHWVESFDGIRKLKVGGRSVVVTTHEVESATGLAEELDAVKPAAIVVCNGVANEIAIDRLAALTRASKALSITTRETEVVGGLAVGIVPGKTRDQIVVNTSAAVAEGVKFDAGLLQLARTVKEKP
jgi:hypothetical protein